MHYTDQIARIFYQLIPQQQPDFADNRAADLGVFPEAAHRRKGREPHAVWRYATKAGAIMDNKQPQEQPIDKDPNYQEYYWRP